MTVATNIWKDTETKPFNTERLFRTFSRGTSPLHSSLAKERRIFKKPFKIIVSSTLKKHVSKMYERAFLYSTASHIKKHLLFIIGFLCFVLNCVQTWCFLFLIL